VWLIGVLALVVVVAIAVGIVFGYIFRQNPIIETTTTAQAPGPVVSEPPATYQSPQSSGCNVVSAPVKLNCWYYKLGDDMIPAYDIIGGMTGTVTNVVVDPTYGATTMTVEYLPDDNAAVWMIDYVQWMRDFSGYLQGPRNHLSGSMWRMSVDSGAVITLQYGVDSGISTVTVTKDWTGAFLAGLDSNALATVHPRLRGHATLTLTPATGWKQYSTWQNSSDYDVTTGAITLAKVDGNDIVGTLLLTRGTFNRSPYPNSVEGLAQVWTTDFHPQPPEIDIGPASTMDVAGTTAVTYRLLLGSAVFYWVFIPDADGAFVIMAITRTDSPANPAADVESMLSSIVLSK